MSDLERSILRTVCFFSLFDYPLTTFEVWKWLAEPTVAYTIQDVRHVLASSDWLAKRLEHHDGSVVLKGKGHLLATRHRRFVDAARKYHRLKRVGRYLALLPMVRAVAACNTLAWNNTKPESDIDLYILATPGTLWLTRLLTVTPFALLGMRPKVGAIDPVCFSFFAASSATAMRGLCLSGRDLYLGQWVRSLVPVIDRGEFAGIATNNGWVEHLFPNSFAMKTAVTRRVSFRPKHTSRLARIFEPFARLIQKPRLPSDIRGLANRDTRVVINDRMLKFHPNDRRGEFLQRLAQLEASLV